jgi:hypothetical protein
MATARAVIPAAFAEGGLQARALLLRRDWRVRTGVFGLGVVERDHATRIAPNEFQRAMWRFRVRRELECRKNLGIEVRDEG